MSTIIKGLALSLIIMFVAACKASHQNSETKDFYANSRRTPGDADAERYVLRLLTNGRKSCTAFLVKNGSGLTLAATAKHCVKEDPVGWCEQGQFRSPHSSKTVNCDRVIAWNSRLDIVIFEADDDFPGTVPLSIFSGYPQVGTRLKVIGYPADRYASSGVNVTANCWIRQSSVPSPYNDTLDRSAKHNCSIYGGNSGGPVLIEGTSTVIGMPYTYKAASRFPETWDDLMDPWDHNNFDDIALFHDFVQKFQGQLSQFGVDFSDQQVSRGTAGAYLAVGRCRSDTLSNQPIYLTPKYNTGRTMKKLHVEFEESGYKEDYVCTEGVTCDSLRDSDSFKVLGPRRLRYKTRAGAQHEYRC